jgi:hypothetical protein
MKNLSQTTVGALANKAIGHVESAIVLGQGVVAKAQEDLNSMGKWDRRLYGTLFAVGAAHGSVFAQSPATANAGSAQSTLDQMKTTVIAIGQAVFAIFLMIGLVKVVIKFVKGEPDAMQSLLWLGGGVLLMFGFQALKNQIVTNSGGGGGGVQ